MSSGELAVNGLSSTLAPAGDAAGSVRHGHAVQFYQDDSALLDNVTHSIGAALGAGGAAIVIATEPHRRALAERFAECGINLSVARRQGRYVDLDAAATLARFMVDGHPDPILFRTQIGRVILQATLASRYSACPIAAFGEMVALLWAESNPTGAIELERLWNDLAQTQAFSLLCGYPLQAFGRDGHGDAFDLVCAEHTHVIPGETFTELASEDERARAISILQHKAERLREHELREVESLRTIQQQEVRLRKTEKLAAAGQLAASLAHEINNPLSSVINLLYLLKTSAQDSQIRTLAETADLELTRVARIVRQSLSYYRVGTDPKELDLASLVEESLQIYGEKADRAGIRLSSQITPNLRLVGFADEIRQVIDNLLLNAIEATPVRGRITLSVHPSRRWSTGQSGIRFVIADTGSGISREHRTRIFEPFYTTKAEKGTGLGLWVVSGIIAKHEGHIAVRSTDRPGRGGTVISLFWPSALPATVTRGDRNLES